MTKKQEQEEDKKAREEAIKRNANTRQAFEEAWKKKAKKKRRVNKMKKIITRISEKYGICTYGVKGMEIIKDNKQKAVFTKGKTKLENWEAAVRFMEDK